MITQQTLFILGAGASAPYRYPTGYELRRLIIEEFPKRAAYDDFVKFGPFNEGIMLERTKDKITYEAEELTKEFSKSRTPSIDLFLSRRQQFYEIGRRAIAQIIFEKEKESQFEYDMDDISQDWYSFLYHRMTETLIGPNSYEKFAENKVSFITFNYDRSLEHFLYDALTSSFNIPRPAASKNLFPFKFIHVYGKLADLDWENKEGMRYRGYFLPIMIKNINIIYNGENNTGLKKSIIEEITKAKRIFFLGFGFAKENMDILGIPKSLHHQPKIFATARGWTENEILKIRGYLQSGFKNPDPGKTNPYVKNFDCRKLLREYL